MTMTMSAGGRALLAEREGCRLAAYQDGAGVWTIGVGHTGRATPPAVPAGMTCTEEAADEMLSADLAGFEAAVNRAIARPTTQNQFDALVSLAFNIGAGGFAGSTVVHQFNRGDPAGAADAFLMWVHPPELRRRRIGERAQFLRVDRAGDRVAAAPPVASPGHVAVPPRRTIWDRLRAVLHA